MDATPWLIVGLGNPGPRYAGTRHNVGFMALAAFAAAQWPAHLLSASGSPRWTEKWKGLTATLSCGSQRCVLLQPQTYMNRSGASVVPAMQFHRIPPAQTIVVHDEIDFSLGRLAIKKGGGHGGHNGLRDIVAQLGSAEFLRVRLGVGRPAHGEVADYVLSDFRPDEQGTAADLVERAAKALTCMVTDGVAMAMNKFNTLP
jgi:PTH1 family peptidyl-tRNA hydrolase